MKIKLQVKPRGAPETEWKTFKVIHKGNRSVPFARRYLDKLRNEKHLAKDGRFVYRYVGNHYYFGRKSSPFTTPENRAEAIEWCKAQRKTI